MELRGPGGSMTRTSRRWVGRALSFVDLRTHCTLWAVVESPLILRMKLTRASQRTTNSALHRQQCGCHRCRAGPFRLVPSTQRTPLPPSLSIHPYPCWRWLAEPMHNVHRAKVATRHGPWRVWQQVHSGLTAVLCTARPAGRETACLWQGGMTEQRR